MSQPNDLIANIMDLFNEEDDDDDGDYYPAALPRDYSELAESTEESDTNETMDESEEGEYTGMHSQTHEGSSLNNDRCQRRTRIC